MSEQFKELLLRFKQSLTPKKILLSFLIALIILFPTVLAIISVAHSSNDETTVSSRASTVILYNEDGVELYKENADEALAGDSSLISIFNTIFDNKLEIDDIPSNAATEPPLKAELIWENGTDTLTCYFSFSENGSFCADEADNYYKIPAEDSERFLSSAFAETLYTDSTPPQMLTAEGDTVLPTSTEWYYKNMDGLYLRAQKNALADEKLTYHVTSAISVDFTDEPDACTVEVYSDGEKVFMGAPEELAYMILDSDSVLSVNVNAQWSYLNERNFYGGVSYSFDVLIHNRAEFSIDRSSFAAGEFAILKANNISTLSKLSFVTDMDFKPEFTLVGEVAYAIIPCPNGQTEAESFDFSISYGVSSNKFSIAIEDSELPSSSDFALSLTRLNVDPNDFGKASERYSFLSGLRRAPSETDFSAGRVFGESFTYNYSRTYSFFNEYVCIDSSAIPVLACSGGKVIYTDVSDTLGSVAIVDLGFGIRLWYCNLSTLNVSVGDYVAAGDVIGVTGTLLDGKSEGFTLTMSYYSQILDVNCLFSNDFKL